MIKRIIKWHKRRRRAMRIGMRWLETEEKIGKLPSRYGCTVLRWQDNRKTNSLAFLNNLSKTESILKPRVVVDSRSWAGRP